ncbi:hypothetical protein Q2T76_01650 [Lactobacillus sp. YT155]|uniref:DUF1659 domain-containing protein n=1 Tax=Lactobacillus sp. YT155 TaxID=3060955 RepID=UPI00265FFC73|nr:hypothetical protein [Lactobacillus sp. YT155]MDO1604756.1 hypothetical protein [Lactobacillus sp. YT155]
MEENWKRTSVGLVVVNEDRYPDGVKTYKLNNAIDTPKDEQLISFANAYSQLLGDDLDHVELTRTTTVSANI